MQAIRTRPKHAIAPARWASVVYRETAGGVLSGPPAGVAGRLAQLGSRVVDLTNVKRYGYPMPRKTASPTPNRATVQPLTVVQGGKQPVTFTATPIDRATMPTPGKRGGGRQSNVPAMEAFLAAITEPGVTYQMGSPDADGGHPLNRITQIRKLAGERYKVETSPIESGKRYFVFVTLNA